MRSNHRRSGITLIELLIVIAMISITTSILMVPIIAPMREQIVADGERLVEGGMTTLFAQVVLEAHAARSARFDASARRLTLRVDGREITYVVGADGALRRDAGRGQSAGLLVPNVLEFQAAPTPDGRAVTITIAARAARRDTPVPIRRTVTLSLPYTRLEVLP